jgi:hypothetical protein
VVEKGGAADLYGALEPPTQNRANLDQRATTSLRLLRLLIHGVSYNDRRYESVRVTALGNGLAERFRPSAAVRALPRCNGLGTPARQATGGFEPSQHGDQSTERDCRGQWCCATYYCARVRQ